MDVRWGTDDFSIINAIEKNTSGIGSSSGHLNWGWFGLIFSFSHGILCEFCKAKRSKLFWRENSKIGKKLLGRKFLLFWRILTVHWLWRLVTSGTERTENFSWFLMIWQMSRRVPRGQDGRVALVFSLGLSRFQSNERVIQTSCLVKHQPRNRPLHNYF